jgi:inhibitor of the pro-sigma K processing machinery
MTIDSNTILLGLLGVILLYIFIKVLFIPIKLFMKLILNTVFGGIALWVFNLLGGTIGINLVTAAVVGILGIPGFILLVILQYIK